MDTSSSVISSFLYLAIRKRSPTTLISFFGFNSSFFSGSSLNPKYISQKLLKTPHLMRNKAIPEIVKPSIPANMENKNSPIDHNKNFFLITPLDLILL